MAAARVRAAARRAEQLRERIARLRAGVAPTAEDVQQARAAADAQRSESVKAQQRLLHAYAASADLRRSGTPSDPDPRRAPVATDPPPARETPAGAGPSQVRRLEAENRLLRGALVSIAAGAGEEDAYWSQERRRALWESLVEQCGQESWQGWARALCVTAASMPEIRGMAVSGYDRDGFPYLLAVTDEETRRVEALHQLAGEGPAVEAYRSKAPVMVGRLSDEHARWPGYVAAAADSGASRLCALPVLLHGLALGSATLYLTEQAPRRWALVNGTFLASIASTALLTDLDAVEDGSYPWDAGDDRIQMASGMVSVQLGVTVDEALAVIRAFAFSNARELAQVADAVVDGSLRLM